MRSERDGGLREESKDEEASISPLQYYGGGGEAMFRFIEVETSPVSASYLYLYGTLGPITETISRHLSVSRGRRTQP